MRARLGQRGAIALSQALLAGAVITGGAGVGVGLQQAGVFGGGTEAVEVALDAVPVFDCPDGADVGELHRGDRVLATGRDEAGDWAEVRDPADLSGRVWVRVGYLVPDGDLSGLDVRECATDEVAAPTTTVPFGGLPGPDDDGDGGGGGGGGAADTAGPSITGVSANPGEVWEQFTGFSCPTTSIISATANDPSGVSSLTASWSFASVNETKAITAQFGPFPDDTIANNTQQTVTITITARDTRGNTSTATTQVILHSIEQCFI